MSSETVLLPSQSFHTYAAVLFKQYAVWVLSSYTIMVFGKLSNDAVFMQGCKV